MPKATGSIAYLGAARFQGFWNASTNAASGSGLSDSDFYLFGGTGQLDGLYATGSSTGGGYSKIGAIGSSGAGITASAGDYWQVSASGAHNVDGDTNWNLNDWVVYSGSAGGSGTWRRLAFEDTIASVVIGDLSAPDVFHLAAENDKHVLFVSGASGQIVMSGSDNFTFDHTAATPNLTLNGHLSGSTANFGDNVFVFGALGVTGSINGIVISGSGDSTIHKITMNQLVAAAADINAGTIDGTTLGASSPSSVKATTISGSSTLNVVGASTFGPADYASISADGAISGSGTSTIHILRSDRFIAGTADINGGTVDNATIGATTPSSVEATTISGSSTLHVAGASTFGPADYASISAAGVISGSAISTLHALRTHAINMQSSGLSGATTISGSGAISGDSVTLNGKGSISSAGVVSGSSLTLLNGLSINGSTGPLTVSSLGHVSGTSAYIKENTFLFGDLGVTGSATVAGHISGTSAYIKENTFLFGDLGVTGSATVAGDLAVDTNTLFVDASENKVGIGVSDPDTTLEVLSTSTQLKLSYDSDSYATMNVSAASKLTITSAETGNIELASGGSIDLDSAGAITLDSATNIIKLVGTGSMQFLKFSRGTGGSAGALIEPATLNEDLIFQDFNGSNQIMRIDTSTQRVGIGTGTPSTKLDVSGSTKLGRNDGVTSTHQVTGSVYLTDNSKFVFGENDDAHIEYDEDQTDYLIVSGSVTGLVLSGSTVDVATNMQIKDSNKLYFFDTNAYVYGSAAGTFVYNDDGSVYLYGSAGVRVPDDTKLYFGSSSDSYIEYNENGDDLLVISGSTAGLVLSGSVTVDSALSTPGIVSGTAAGPASFLAVDSDGSVVLAPSIITSSGGGGAVSAVANGADNRLATFSSADALNGEANLTYDGTTFVINDDAKVNDDFPLYFGTNSDAFIKYNENGDDFLVISGSTNGIVLSGSSVMVDGILQFTSFADDVIFGNANNQFSYNNWAASAGSGMSITNGAGAIFLEPSTSTAVVVSGTFDVSGSTVFGRDDGLTTTHQFTGSIHAGAISGSSTLDVVGASNFGPGNLASISAAGVISGSGDSTIHKITMNQLVAATADINGGAIDGTTLGASTPSSVKATTLSGSDNLNVVGVSTFGAANYASISSDGVISGSGDSTIHKITMNQLVAATADINGGSVDGTTIGASSQSSVKATTLSGSSTLNVVGASTFGPADYASISAAGVISGSGDSTIHTVTTNQLHVKGHAVVGSYTAPSNNSSGQTIPAASMLKGVWTAMNRGTSQSDTTDTAANIVAAISNCVVGDAFDFLYINVSPNPVTLAGGTSVTMMNGAAASYSIGAAQGRAFKFLVSNTGSGTQAVSIIPTAAAFNLNS